VIGHHGHSRIRSKGVDESAGESEIKYTTRNERTARLGEVLYLAVQRKFLATLKGDRYQGCENSFLSCRHDDQGCPQ
jgi:hypothetical protein